MSSSSASGSQDPQVPSKGNVKDKKPGYQPLFGVDKQGSVPKWLPVSLLALTTAALAVPIVVLSRQRAAAALEKSAANAPPHRRNAFGALPSPRTTSSSSAPPRFASSGSAPPPRVPGSSASAPPPRISPTSSPNKTVSTRTLPTAQTVQRVVEDNFNGALYSAKAFGFATLLVGAGAVTTVWGVKSVLGVENTREFALQMRRIILYRIPFLSSRIHRPSDLDNDDNDAPQLPRQPQTGTIEWTWSDAEQRLKTAYEEGGIMGWAEAALQELEIEGELERSKRGHS